MAGGRALSTPRCRYFTAYILIQSLIPRLLLAALSGHVVPLRGMTAEFRRAAPTVCNAVDVPHFRGARGRTLDGMDAEFALRCHELA